MAGRSETSFLRHIELNVAPVVADDGAQVTGCRVTLVFEGGLPEISAPEVKALLDPIIDFGVKSRPRPTPIACLVSEAGHRAARCAGGNGPEDGPGRDGRAGVEGARTAARIDGPALRGVDLRPGAADGALRPALWATA